MNALVTFSLKQRLIVLLLFCAVLIGGLIGFLSLNIEAYPDPVPPLVDVITQNPGQSAEEIERYITTPIEVALAGIPHMQTLRTISLFGLSDVKVQFSYDLTYEEAEQRVINRLSELPQLPGGAQPAISPESPSGEIYRYRLVGPPGFSLADLKTLQDWVLERRFKALPGVIDVTGWGGRTRTYDVAVDQRKLAAFNIGLGQVLQALNNSNVNVGGQTVHFGPQSAVVRGIGLITSLEDISATMVTAVNGDPVLIRDIATVTAGAMPRLGIAGQDEDDDVVEGIVLMRRGAESKPTITRVKEEIAKINGAGVLPPGVSIKKVYDRSDLISVTTRTVLENMLTGIALIFVTQWLFLGDLRCAVIVAASIPFALSFAIGLMVMLGKSANLLSVGAIDFGLVVDATVIMVENIFRHLSESPEVRKRGYAFQHTIQARSAFRGKLGVIAISAQQVGRSIFFSAAIIIAGFMPLFTMSGIEGHIFGPMAQTYGFAIAGGLIATFTVSPVLSSYLLKDGMRETETRLVAVVRRVLVPACLFTLKNRVLTLGLAGTMIVLAILGATRLGLEFLPKLEEGNLWIRATLPASITLEAGNGAVNRIRHIIQSFPEVETVISQQGRPDDGTDATGFFNAEFFVPLKPTSMWPRGVDKPRLVQQVQEAVSKEFIGIDLNFSQYIEDNVEEAASGVKGENSVKVFGNDLAVLERTAGQIKDILNRIPGVTDVAVLSSLGQPTVRIDVDRARAARYGLAPGDVNATVQAAVGGQAAGDLYDPGSDRHFPIMVRLAEPFRNNLEAIQQINVATNMATGGATYVALKDIARVRLVSGAAFIYREQQERYLPIKFSIRGRDLGSAVNEARGAVNRDVRLPNGYRTEWVGDFGNLRAALDRLSIAVPLSIVSILVLLYLNFGCVADTLLAASVIPMALVGGVTALWLTSTPFSVSAAIGFVALFGIAAMDGIIVISYFRQQLAAGLDRTAALARTSSIQARPILMTCMVACVGLLPAAISTGIGSQVQRPLALVVVGGMMFAPILILIVLPVLIATFVPEGVASIAQAAEVPAE